MVWWVGRQVWRRQWIRGLAWPERAAARHGLRRGGGTQLQQLLPHSYATQHLGAGWPAKHLNQFSQRSLTTSPGRHVDLRRQRLEAELASRSASVEERQHAAALVAAQAAELQAYAAEVEREQQEQLLLEQRIRAMESKVWRRGCLGRGVRGMGVGGLPHVGLYEHPGLAPLPTTATTHAGLSRQRCTVPQSISSCLVAAASERKAMPASPAHAHGCGCRDWLCSTQLSSAQLSSAQLSSAEQSSAQQSSAQQSSAQQSRAQPEELPHQHSQQS